MPVSLTFFFIVVNQCPFASDDCHLLFGLFRSAIKRSLSCTGIREKDQFARLLILFWWVLSLMIHPAL